MYQETVKGFSTLMEAGSASPVDEKKSYHIFITSQSIPGNSNKTYYLISPSNSLSALIALNPTKADRLFTGIEAK